MNHAGEIRYLTKLAAPGRGARQQRGQRAHRIPRIRTKRSRAPRARSSRGSARRHRGHQRGRPLRAALARACGRQKRASSSVWSSRAMSPPPTELRATESAIVLRRRTAQSARNARMRPGCTTCERARRRSRRSRARDPARGDRGRPSEFLRHQGPAADESARSRRRDRDRRHLQRQSRIDARSDRRARPQRPARSFWCWATWASSVSAGAALHAELGAVRERRGHRSPARAR